MTDGPIEAIHRGDLAGWAVRTLDRAAADPSSIGPDEVALAERARVACTTIGEQRRAEHRDVVAALADADVATDPPPADASPSQRIEIVVRVGLDEVDAAIAALRPLGYRRHRDWSAAAERSLRRTGHEVVVARSDDVTRTVRLRWRAPRRRGPVARALTPTPADWASVELPRRAWWAYRLVRPVRLVGERLGIRSADHADLEPFLVTPMSLIAPVLDLARVGADDCVLDLGCGDGRIVIEAAERLGCRALGVERAADRAAAAIEAVGRRGLADRVTIVEGDGLVADLTGVDVAALFLPAVVVRRVVPILLDRLAPGARIVLHEQSRLHGVPPPDRSVPIVTEDAATVAHRWDVV